MLTCYMFNCNFLASLCSWGDWFETHFAGNPEDRFCRADTQIMQSIGWKVTFCITVKYGIYMYIYSYSGFSEEQAKDIRVTFHPEYELPQMRLWYKRYQNPSETKLNFFANELNKGHVRQERPQVTVAKLKNWWKNERQKEKRINMKEGSNEKEEKEIEKLRAESLRRSARRKFIDKDSTQVKVAKVVPSPQRSPESNPQQHGSYVDPHRTQQLTSSNQSVMMSSLGLLQTVTSGSHQQASNTISPQPSMVMSSLSQVVSSGSPQQTPTGISYPIVSVVDRPVTTPSGFVSLLQHNPVASENQTGNQGRNPLVIENQPRYQGQPLAETNPGTRIGTVEYSGGGSGDNIEMRHYDF